MAERRNRGRRDKRVGENNCCVVVGARHHPGGLSGGCPSSSKTTPRQVMVGMPPVKVRVLGSEREIQMAKCAQLDGDKTRLGIGSAVCQYVYQRCLAVLGRGVSKREQNKCCLSGYYGFCFVCVLRDVLLSIWFK